MDELSKVVERAKQVFDIEIKCLESVKANIDDSFGKAVSLIHDSKGRLIVTGIGKSAIIAQKIVATFNSTGCPAIFMHAADAIHGDLGIIQKEDIVLVLSKSGDSPEIKVLTPYLKSMGNKVIGMVSNKNSVLAYEADIDRTYIPSIEKGERNVSITVIEKIAKALKVKISVLFDE